MTDFDFARRGLENHGTGMNGNEAHFCAWLLHRTSARAVADLRDVVRPDATGIEPHGKRLSDCAGWKTACNGPMAT